MIDMNVKLETWKNKLLDLGKRNRLLNYRDTRRSNLRIMQPEIFDLWNKFVVNEKPLVFPYYDEEILDRVDNDFIKETNAIATNQSLKDQQKTLRNLRNKAKTFMEEQGVNVLYLSFGFLRWKESESSNVYFDAPLILVPVTLSWSSITAPFILSLHEDEIVLNPTLLYKLENDFGIKLPDFDAESDLQAYFDSLQDIVVTNHWEIITEVGLGLLSFLKINMYRDLENHRDSILQNPVVKALGGEKPMQEYDVSAINNFDHDNDKYSAPDKTFQVLDADASQQDAIYCAKKSLSFVLQGPPGTGKSQTITNIIAECLASGKKVLFVSEKMAALEVVHNRLAAANLADFCLILHSHKENKKQMLAQLGDVINLAQKKTSVNDDVYQKFMQLSEDKQRLNDYANAIHTIIEPLHKTIYEVNGQVAQLQNCDEVIFAIPDVRQTSAETYQKYITVLNSLGSVAAKMNGDYHSNPWYGANIAYINNELRHDIGSFCSRLLPKLQSLAELLDFLPCECKLDFDDTYAKMLGLLHLLSTAAKSPGVPVEWVVSADNDIIVKLIEIGADMQRNITLLQQKAAQTGRLYQEDLSSVSAIKKLQIELQNNIAGNACWQIWHEQTNEISVEKMLHLLTNSVGDFNNYSQQVSTYFTDLVYTIDYKAINQHFSDLYTPAFLANCTQYELDKKEFISCCKDFNNQYSNSDILMLLGKVCRYAELKNWVEAAPEISKYNALCQEISNNYEKEIESIDYNAMYLRFKTASQSITKLFNSQYRNDKATILSLCRNGGKKITDSEVIDILNKMREKDNLQHWLNDSEEYTQYKQLKKELTEKFTEAIYSIDYNAIFNRFKLEYNEEFMALYAQRQADFALLKKYCQSGITLTDSIILEQMSNLLKIQQTKELFAKNDNKFASLFITYYQKEHTDIAKFQQLFVEYQQIKQYQNALNELCTVLTDYEYKEPELRQRFAALYQGLNTDWNYVRDCLGWAEQLKSIFGNRLNDNT